MRQTDESKQFFFLQKKNQKRVLFYKKNGLLPSPGNNKHQPLAKPQTPPKYAQYRATADARTNGEVFARLVGYRRFAMGYRAGTALPRRLGRLPPHPARTALDQLSGRPKGSKREADRSAGDNRSVTAHYLAHRLSAKSNNGPPPASGT
jgi:hypothetical protein